MTRVVLTDGSGRWFDRDAATRYDEDTHWNGRNRISQATGSPWDHEALYRTAGGRWVLHHWSQWQGAPETWTEIDAATAARWLAVNGYEPPPGLEAAFAALEIG